MSGCVAMTNVSEIDAWTEVVNSDGSTMRVRARWDGDVWVETDDCLLMETRRWMERGSMIVARTVSSEDGTMVTAKQYFTRCVKRATNVSVRPKAIAPATKEATQALPTTKKPEKDDDEVSIFTDMGARFFGVFGGGDSPKEGRTERGDVLKTFDLPAKTEFVASYECSLVTPKTLPNALSNKGDKGTLYVIKHGFAFIGGDEKNKVAWYTDAMAVQELTVEGVNSISMEIADGSAIKIHNIKGRDRAFDSMIAMLESMPDSEDKTVATNTSPNGPPLKFGFSPEMYVFLQLLDVSVEGAAANVPGTPTTTLILGDVSHSVASTNPVPTGFGGYSANIEQTVVMTMASLNEFEGEHVAIVVRDSQGDEIGEAMLPIAALPRDEVGKANVRAAPFAINLSIPRKKVEGPGAGLRTKPVSKNAARGIGTLNVAAWIGSASEAAGFVNDDKAEGTVAKKAIVRVTPALAAITVNARMVRGLNPTESKSIRCIISYGSQEAETSETSVSTTEDMRFSFGEASFNTEAPCTGLVRVDVVTCDTGEVLGTTEVDVANLPKRRIDRHGQVSDPPAGRYYKLQSTDEGEEAGFVFLQAYIDPALTYSQQQKPLLGELKVKVLKMEGLPEGRSPALVANVGSAWALLPGNGSGGPSGWKRELHAAVRDASEWCTIVIYDRLKTDEILGKIRFSPFSLPEHGRAIICTIPLTTKDIFGTGTENGEITLRLQFKQQVSNTALFVHYCTPVLPPSAYRPSDMDTLLRDLDMVNYERLVTGHDALPEPAVRSILEVSEADASIATPRRTKAAMIRLAATLETFKAVVKPLTQAVSWEKPMYTAALHVAIFVYLWMPRLMFVAYFAFVAWHISLRNKPTLFTILGENKSRLVGSVDVTRAPAGSTRAPLSSLIRESHAVAALTAPSHDAYDNIVQFSFWCQAQVEFLREPLEKFHTLLSWDDEGDSARFQTMLLGAAVGFLFIPFRFVAAVILFACLRHPWVMKPPVPPYKIAIARAIAPA